MLVNNNLMLHSAHIMNTIDTLLYPRWIIPVEPDPTTVLTNHALAIDQGRIVELLPAEQANARYQAHQVVTLNDHAILPGLINTHTHSAMTLMRGMVDDLALTAWNNVIWPIESHWISEEFVQDGIQLALLEMLRSGTTCFNEHYFLADVSAATTAAAGMRAMMGELVFEVPTRYAQNAAGYLQRMENFYAAWRNHALIKPCAAPHGPHTVDDATLLHVKAFSEEHQLKVHIHLLESENEIQHNIKHYGKRPLQRLADLGLITPLLQCAHMIYITADEMEILRHGRPHILHLPESNFKLASGFCPVEQYRQLGLNVALGTDGAASNNDLDMFGEMRSAALLAKALTHDPTALNAAATLQMATINGAKALGWQDEIGSLLPGKAADIIAVDLSAINTQPVYHVISQLVYAVNSRQVSDVWVAGKRLLQQGQYTQLDAPAILAKVQEWRKRLGD